MRDAQKDDIMNINIGGTKHWQKVNPLVRKSWMVMDIAGRPDYKYDLNSGTFFPFGPNSINNYYSSHTLEHIKPELIGFVLAEIYKSLRPGGLIRIVVPDVSLAIQKYVNCDQRWLNEKQGKAAKRHGYPQTMLGHLMLWFYSYPKGTVRSGHNTVFDWKTLEYYFRLIGFKNIKRMQYEKCSPIFKGLDFFRHAETSLYLEAQK